MTAQPERPHVPETGPRVPRTINGIADALTGARRMSTVTMAEVVPRRGASGGAMPGE